MVEIEIDGKKVKAEKGEMLIDVADREGITIPRFCYHKKLSVAANCRMCLIDLEGCAKPLPACATPVAADMVVSTQSQKALAAQRAVMEFLLINHPLDCPICDQGGECELQDLSIGFGEGISRYSEGKRSVHDDDLGSLISAEMTRCIHCTRCVRFGEEIAGMRELGLTYRGEHTHISTYVRHAMSSEVSGNVIDLCPVGALTSKPFRFTARAWELRQLPSIAPHDCWGANIFVHTRSKPYAPDRHVMRVVPRDNESVNETWISDRDRFAYAGLNGDDRLAKPRIKRGGHWIEVDWQTALNFVAGGLRRVRTHFDAEHIAGLISPNASLEELYLFQKLLRGVGTHAIDHRVHQTDFSDQGQLPVYPSLGCSIEELEGLDAVLLMGSNLRHEQPLAAVRLRKAALNGGAMMAINPMDYEFTFPMREQAIVGVGEMVTAVAGVAKAMLAIGSKQAPQWAQDLLRTITPTESQTAMARHLQAGKEAAVLIGALVMNHPHAATLRSLARLIAEMSGSTLGYLTEGANSAGAWLAGAVPHRGPGGVAVETPGLTADEVFTNPRQGYVLFGIEPELDCARAGETLNALRDADFVVSMTSFNNPELDAYADAVLPLAPFTESSGTLVNVEGRWQQYRAVMQPYGQAKPGWKILRVLGNLFGLEGFEYSSAHEVVDELKTLIEGAVGHEGEIAPLPALPTLSTGMHRIAEWPMYRVDSIVRRAPALQESAAATAPCVSIHPDAAKRLEVAEGDRVSVSQNGVCAELPVVLDARVAVDNAYIPAGFQETAGLSESCSRVDIRRSK